MYEIKFYSRLVCNSFTVYLHWDITIHLENKNQSNKANRNNSNNNKLYLYFEKCETLKYSSCIWCVLKICSLVFSDIVHDGRRPWYLMTDAVRFWKRKNWQLDFGPNGLKLDLKLGFLAFSQIWFIGFPYNCIQWRLWTMCII